MKKPNILVIMPDTLRGDSLASAGHPAVQTPNLDRLASMGVRFDNAYSSSPICMPARSNCISGLYSHNTGQWSNTGHLPAGTRTYMSVLRENGYRTAHIGKSHYYVHSGQHLESEKDYVKSLGHEDVLETTGPWATLDTDSILTDRWRKMGLLDMFRDDYLRRQEVGPFKATWPSPLPEDEHMDTFVVRTAARYLRDYDDERPFAVFVGIGGPHDPWDPPQAWADRFEDVDVPAPLPPTEAEAWLGASAQAFHKAMMGEPADKETWQAIRRLYYAKIAHLDSLVGELLDVLEAKGELDNTVIAFWSDHGDRLCDRGKVHKSVYYDESARVPLILRLPGNPGAGKGCESIVSINDIFPTVLEAAGVESVDCFGQSLVPATADAGATFHEAVFSEIENAGGRTTMIRTQRYKMVINVEAETLQLFDMQKDPRELQNLAGRGDMSDLERDLKDRIFRWRLETGTDLQGLGCPQ
ncbi:MAG: sulfatase-like hydrolase/transferase [Kiritimatiellae bacterium]|nr:sulfatase-like hydrolase/transferase [Kiritimatiellia bacterium]